MSLLGQKNLLNETGFKAYVEYLALKRHFTSSYDYHKYGGKVSATFDSFLVRRDAYTFQKLGKQQDYKGLLLSNIVSNPKIWVGSILEDSAKEQYLEWKRIQSSITNHVKESLETLDDDFKKNFVVSDGDYPHVVTLYLQKQVSLETLCILAKTTNSVPHWKENVSDNIVFPDILRKIDKYYPFINYSQEKVKKVIRDHFF
jgi:hypothetical protein